MTSANFNAGLSALYDYGLRFELYMDVVVDGFGAERLLFGSDCGLPEGL